MKTNKFLQKLIIELLDYDIKDVIIHCNNFGTDYAIQFTYDSFYNCIIIKNGKVELLEKNEDLQYIIDTILQTN